MMTLTDDIKAQKNVELRKRVFRALQSMYVLFRSSPHDTQMVDRYMNIWQSRSGDIQDVIEFPYESTKGSMAEDKDAKHCLFALVTTMIELWHEYCGDGIDDLIAPLESRLDKIEVIIKHDLQLQIKGSDVTGYYLRVAKGK